MDTDPAKIDRIINKLKMLWKNYPTLRFPQLIGNLLGSDIYYKTDEELEDAMKKAFKEWK